jgi:hypothetical protein
LNDLIRWDLYSLYLMLAVELIGLTVGIIRWSILGVAERFAVVWLGAGGLFDLMARLAAHFIHNSQITAKFWYPISVVLALSMTAALSRANRWSQAMRFATIVYAAVWFILLVTAADRPMAYSRFVSPLHSLLLLSAGLFVLFQEVALSRQDLLRQPGFLLAVGLIGYAVPSAFQSSIAQIALPDHIQTGVTLYGVRGVLVSIAMLIMIRALLLTHRNEARVGT